MVHRLPNARRGLSFPLCKFSPARGWAAVVALLVLEFLLFRRFLLREVVWAYPPNTDQVAYLQQSYEEYDRIRTHGLWDAISHQPDAPQGIFLQLQAAILFEVLGGASRLAALSLNFFYFALLQVSLVGSLRWLSGRWSIAFLGLGLLLAASVPFNEAGGIYDFRMDFIAFCLYGTFLCVAIRSGLFANLKWSAVAGLCGAALIGFRFITAIYLAALFGLMLALAVGAFVISADAIRKPQAIRRIFGMLVAGMVMLLLAGPVLWGRRLAIDEYYVVNHVTGAEKDVRAAETGTTQFWAALRYYPNSLLWDQAGIIFTGAAAFMLVAASAMLLHRRLMPLPSEGQGSARPFSTRQGVIFLAAALLLPMAILTADVSKSPVVAGILVSPVLWLVLFGFAAIIGAFQRSDLRKFTEASLVIGATIAVLLGISVQARAYGQNRWMSRHRRDAQNISALCDQIASRSKAAGWRDVPVFNDCVTDYLDVQIVDVLTFERHGYVLHAGDEIPSVLEMPEAQVLALLCASKFAILSHRVGPPPAYDYPINHELERLHDSLEADCQRSMAEIGRYRIYDREVQLFIRR